MKNSADYWINRLHLQPHPEGGYYKEVYRNPLTSEVNGRERNLATSIYFLLKEDQKSHLHQLESDELWYFHAGAGVVVHIFDQGVYRKEVLGPNGALQVLLPARSIFAAETADKNSFCLLGCMVNPGFDFRDFRLVAAEELLAEYPDHSGIIGAFTLKG